jgi:hypothetical protein
MRDLGGSDDDEYTMSGEGRGGYMYKYVQIQCAQARQWFVEKVES